MSERFTVRAGQKWHIKNENDVDVYITILDMYICDVLEAKENSTLFYKIERDFGGKVSEELFIDLHKDLAKGWELVKE
jgi:hypothetical protein